MFGLDFYDYLFVGAFLFLHIIVLILGLRQSIKIILGTYVVILVCIGISSSLDLFVAYLESNPLTFLKNPDGFINFLFNNKNYIVITFYMLLTFLVIFRYDIGVRLKIKPIKQFLLNSLFAPLAVIMLIVGFEFAVWGLELFDRNQLFEIVGGFGDTLIFKYFLIFFPFWLSFCGLVLIIFFSIYRPNKKRVVKTVEIPAESMPSVEDIAMDMEGGIEGA